MVSVLRTVVDDALVVMIMLNVDYFAVAGIFVAIICSSGKAAPVYQSNINNGSTNGTTFLTQSSTQLPKTFTIDKGNQDSLASAIKHEVLSTSSEMVPTSSVSLKKQTVVEDPHQISAASVEKFIDSYFSKNITNQTRPSEQPTEAPSVSHLLHVLSLATDRPTSTTSTTTHKSIISNVTNKKVKKTVSAPAASPLLSSEQNRVSLSAGNIIGITIGVSVLIIGMGYIGLSYFPRAKRRSSYNEMFIHDHENEEEIALADCIGRHEDADTDL